MALQLPAFMKKKKPVRRARKPTMNMAPNPPRWTSKPPSYYSKKAAAHAHSNNRGLPSISNLSATQRAKLNAIAALLAGNKKLAQQWASATSTNIPGNSMAAHARRRAQPLPGRRRSPSPKRRSPSPRRTMTMNNLF